MKLKVAKQTVQIARRNGRGSLGKCSSNEEKKFELIQLLFFNKYIIVNYFIDIFESSILT